MTTVSLLDQLVSALGTLVSAARPEALDPWLEVTPENLDELCRRLKGDPDSQFDLLNCITAVDYCQPDEKKAARVEWQPHLEVIYHLSSTTKKHRLVVKVKLPRWKDGVPGQLPELPTLSHLWRTADWHERELYDLMGITFRGHPDLRRILCPEDWQGHPLRKDYEMPLEYHGIRGR